MRKKTDKTIFKNCISEKFRKQLYFLPVFHLIMFFMKAQITIYTLSGRKLADIVTFWNKGPAAPSIVDIEKQPLLKQINAQNHPS